MKLPVALALFTVLAPLSGFSVEPATPIPASTAANTAADAPGVGPFNTVWPGFAKVRDARFARFEKTKAKDVGAVVFFGDSITEMWDVAKAFPQLKTANRGISGDTSRGMLGRLKDNVLDLHPKAVVLLCGINDLNQPTPGTPEEIAANVKSILTALRASDKNLPIFVPEVTPSSSRPLQVIRETNAAVDKVVAGFPGVARVRTFDALADEKGEPKKALFKDHTHPNAAGYAVYGPVVKAAFINAGLLPASE